MYAFIARYYKGILLLIPVISLLMHLHIFNRELMGYHIWRQAQTQTVINNFYREDMNILHPRGNDGAGGDRLLRMEFPVMQWIFACFFKVFGNHIIISRLLSFIIGIGSVFGICYMVYNIWQNKATAAIAAWVFNFSPVFYYYTVNPLPDNFALCCGVWSAAFFFKYSMGNGSMKHIMLSALFLCFATLAKLPFILYAVIPAVYGLQLLIQDRRNFGRVSKMALAYLLFLVPPAAWYAWVIPTWDSSGIVAGILDSQYGFSGIMYIISRNLIATLPELLINYASVLSFLAGIWFVFRDKLYRHRLFPALALWLLAMIAYFFFELNMIGTEHDYYLFPFLPLVFLLVCYGAYRLLTNNKKLLRVLSTVALCILPLTAFLRADTRWDEDEPGLNKAVYDNKEELRRLTPPNAYCIVGNDNSHFILLYYIDRKGWSFYNDDLTREKLDGYIRLGAGYLFTDSRVDERPEIKERLGEKIFDKGTFRVYKLK